VRKPNIRSAAADFGLLVVALIAGLAGADLWIAGALYALAIALWGWTRRRSLAQLPLQQRLIQGAIALVMLAVTMGLFYWMGLMMGGHA
jgi:hypothetical protein